jgi:hypothetical protein
MRDRHDLIAPAIESATALSSTVISVIPLLERGDYLGEISHFKVRIQPSFIGEPELELVLNKNREGKLLITGLSAESSYKISISAITADGQTPYSTPSDEIKTLAPPIIIIPVTVNLTTSGNQISPASHPTDVTPLFTYPVDSYTLTLFQAVDISPAQVRGSGLSYSMNPVLQGLTINSATGKISGTPTKTYGSQEVTITAANNVGSYSLTLQISVVTSTYPVGSIGPGGGLVFFLSRTPFKCGVNLERTCSNLEYAPRGWSGTELDPVRPWSSVIDQRVTAVGGNGYGAGLYSSERILGQLGDTQSAVSLARNYRGGGFDDWYLPNAVEAQKISLFASSIDYPYTEKLSTAQSAGGIPTLVEFERNYYWISYGISSLDESEELMYYFEFGTGDYSSAAHKLVNEFAVRPIRAF